ncbi:lectin MOA-related protein [Bacteroides sp.]|uniref:lectin MOA-related protein n=1 Tax=Bacteroides sp. TaxID=29523 RepID=UPI0026018430|nr:lectin MOA-related protein [Bacteroides sp.]MDD3039564.1 lectin MOA-related protein [Bacteroides sp.]
MSFFTFIDGFRDGLIPKQTANIQVTGDKLTEILCKEFGATCHYHVVDRKYRLVDKEWFTTFITKYSAIEKFKYQSDFFDCDSFAFVLKGEIERLQLGLAVGFLSVTTPDGSSHMLNFYVDKFSEVFLVEPQSDKVFKLKDSGYTPFRFEI